MATGCADATSLRTLAIVRGEADQPEELPGVVRLERADRYCSGTVVATDGMTAWVLTAAHCVIDPFDLAYVGHPLETARIGAVLAEATSLPVGRSVVHPRYDLDRHDIAGNVDPWPVGSAWDLALVEIPDGAPLVEAFVVAPMTAAEDAMAVGTPLRIAGWGISEWPDVAPAVRQRAVTAVAEVVTTLRTAADLLIVDESGDAPGPCFGDSGGPAIADGPEGPRVAGVASGNVTVVAPCADKATYARVSQGEAFLTAVRAGETVTPESCASCAVSATAAAGACEATAAGLAQAGAWALVACLRESTWEECAGAQPLAAAALEDHYACLRGACVTCPAGIAALARCGLDYDGLGPCADCMVGAADCCAAMATCHADPTCKVCLDRTDFPPACAVDPLFVAAITCLRSACPDSCGPYVAYAPGIEPDGGPPDAGPGLDAGRADAASPAHDAGLDAAPADAATDAGAPREPGDDGCGCRAVGANRPNRAMLWVLGVVALGRWRRRSRLPTSHAKSRSGAPARGGITRTRRCYDPLQHALALLLCRPPRSAHDRLVGRLRQRPGPRRGR